MVVVSRNYKKQVMRDLKKKKKIVVLHLCSHFSNTRFPVQQWLLHLPRSMFSLVVMYKFCYIFVFNWNSTHQPLC